MVATLKVHEYGMPNLYPWVHYRVSCEHGGGDEGELRIGATPKERADLIERLISWMQAWKNCTCGQEILDRYAAPGG